MKDGIWGNNGRSVSSVATLTCEAPYYPSGTGRVQGYVPSSRTKSSTCRIGEDGWGYWDNGRLNCHQGNEDSIAFSQT